MSQQKRAFDLLKAFESAAHELCNEWHDDLNPGYPLGESFDEVCHRISQWRGTVQEQMRKASDGATFEQTNDNAHVTELWPKAVELYKLAPGGRQRFGEILSIVFDDDEIGQDGDDDGDGNIVVAFFNGSGVELGRMREPHGPKVNDPGRCAGCDTDTEPGESLCEDCKREEREQQQRTKDALEF